MARKLFEWPLLLKYTWGREFETPRRNIPNFAFFFPTPPPPKPLRSPPVPPPPRMQTFIIFLTTLFWKEGKKVLNF